MATLTVQQIAIAGLVESLVAAAAGGDEFLNDGNIFVLCTNGATDVSITFETPNTVGGNEIADRVVLVSASTTELIGPFPPSIYNDSDVKVQMTYDNEVNVTLNPFRLS